MAAVDQVAFLLRDAADRTIGQLTISLLPSLHAAYGLPALVDYRDRLAENPDGIEPVQLLEGCEYVYSVAAKANVQIDKCELFIADDRSGTRGRLRTMLATGRVEVHITVDGTPAQPLALEIRSTKLGYLDDYRFMLEQIAEVGTELLLERFAPSEQRLAIDPTSDARTIYQRFVFLRGILQGERFSAALRKVIASPYVQWETTDQYSSPGQGMRSSGQLARQLLRAGRRVDWPAATHPQLRSLPIRVPAPRTEQTLDNIPNRFVLFALEQWRRLIASMLEFLERERRSASRRVPAPVARGLREGAALAEHLDDLIRTPLFRDVGQLGELPLGNQVLQKKEGYRDILHAYLVVNLGASLSWAGGEDVFSGGQRNVATLYEYWVYLTLAKLVSALCEEPLDLRSLVSESANELKLLLCRGQSQSVTGRFRRRGRSFGVELCFNQQFSYGRNGTWTKSLRPDCSLHIVPQDLDRKDDDIWLHFDAKYRLNRIGDLLGDEDRSVLSANIADLDKMHTYRDAIVRAVGAYIIFPGTEPLTRERYDEVLPSLGGFPLRPSAGGGVDGQAALRDFLQRVFDHVATQTTKHERERYWRRKSTRGDSGRSSGDSVSFLRAPPADTPVLLGYVKGAAHHQWIEEHGLYNLRADVGRRGAVGLRGSELSAELVALHGDLGTGATLFRVVDEPQLATAEDLLALGYPTPMGKLYFCARIAPIPDPPTWWSAQRVQAVAQQHRGSRAPDAPVVVSWRELATETPT